MPNAKISRRAARRRRGEDAAYGGVAVVAPVDECTRSVEVYTSLYTPLGRLYTRYTLV